MLKIKDSLFIGSVINYNKEEDRGIIRMAEGTAKLKFLPHYTKLDNYFIISNSTVPLYINKIVVYRLEFDHREMKLWATDIQDFEPAKQTQFSKSFLYSVPTNPEFNPHLFNFFIDQNFIYSDYRDSVQKITHTELIINNLSEFEKNIAAANYQIKLVETALYRSGRDDIACISIQASRNYFENDPYVNSFLPVYNNELAYESAYISCDILLSSLWKQLGGGDTKVELERKCKAERSTAIEYFLANYDPDEHLNFLIAEKNKVSRKMRASIDLKFKDIELFY